MGREREDKEWVRDGLETTRQWVSMRQGTSKIQVKGQMGDG